MIKKLIIKNFAIIDNMTVDFHKGFNVITGETGAGKSLIINAIDILFGSKVNQEMVRLENKSLEISALFNIDNEDIVISKKYTDGRSQSFLNNKKITKSELIQSFSNLAQFQKQHDSNKLLNNSKHIDFLDNYSLNQDDLFDLQKLYHEYMNSKKAYMDMLGNDSHYKDKLSLYKYQSEELSSIALDSDKELTINREYKKYNNSKKIRDILNNYSIENSDNRSMSSIIDKLIKSLAIYRDLDEEINEISLRLEQTVLELKDINDEVYNIEKKYYFNSDELEILESKLQKYEEIKRKYGGSLESAIIYKRKIDEELMTMPSFDDKIKTLEKDFLNNKLNYEKKASKISKIRKKAAIDMSDKINHYLANMDMPDAKIKIKINQLDACSEKGFDECEFFAITNKGEEYKPIRQIASGGEISRIMLSVNLVIEKIHSSNTLIFDEVDTGISGITASNIGYLLNKLSNRRQLIIITHLPQIASKSDSHIYVYKKEHNNRIVSLVKTLEEDGHNLEIARMLSGKRVTRHSIQQAKEMILKG